MKFKIHREHLLTGLQQVLNVVSTRATMPILSNVLIEAKDKHLSLTTTNLDLGIRCRIRADVEVPGGITLPVRRLTSIVQTLPNDLVQVEATSANAVKVVCSGTNAKIMGIGTEEFPALPSFEDKHRYNLRQEELVQMLKSVSYAQSTDENRYILNGVYFQFEANVFTMVATDGRRLALTSKEVPTHSDNAGNLILPAKTVAELERTLGRGDEVKITFNDRQAAFEIQTSNETKDTGLVESIYLVSKIVEGSYPNYRQVIPKETEHRVKVERELMLDCVKRAAAMTSDKNNSVKLKLGKNLLEVSGQSSEFGEIVDKMAINYEGPEVSVAFNPGFLMDPLKALTKDEVFFEFKDELSPGLFKTLDSFMCVIMPLRLT